MIPERAAAIDTTAASFPRFLTQRFGSRPRFICDCTDCQSHIVEPLKFMNHPQQIGRCGASTR